MRTEIAVISNWEGNVRRFWERLRAFLNLLMRYDPDMAWVKTAYRIDQKTDK